MSNKSAANTKQKHSKCKLKPKLRFPEFRTAGDWEKTQLSDLLFETKQRNRALTYGPNEVLSVSGEFGCVNQIELLGRSYAGVSVKDYHIVETGDVVYTKSPLKRNPYGIIKANKGKAGIVSTLYAVYRTTDLGLPDYLDHYFSRDYNLNSYLQPIVRKGAKNDMKVNNTDVLSGYIWAPKRKEQERISACLTSLDELIAAYAQKLGTLRSYKEALEQRLFPRDGETTPRLRFPEFRGGPEWASHKFGDFVVESFYGTSESTSDKGQYPVLRMGNMVDGGLDFTNLVYIDLDREKFDAIRLKKGDILLNRTNSRELVGKVSLFELESECITASYIVAFRLNTNEVDPSFCNLMLNTQLYQAQIKLLSTPSISQANINPTTFRNSLDILIPTKSEQRRIATCISSLGQTIFAQVKKLEALKTHKQGLMQQLFPSTEEVEA